MSKKKKIALGIGALFLLVIGFVLYRNFQIKQSENYWKISRVYGVIRTETYGSPNPINSGLTTVKELIKNPPPVDLNTSDGLYVSAMAYELSTGKTLDYMKIKEMMDQGKVLEVYPELEEYLDWFIAPSNSGKDYRKNYENALIEIAVSHGIPLGNDISYEDYQYIIETYPDEIAAWSNQYKNKKENQS